VSRSLSSAVVCAVLAGLISSSLFAHAPAPAAAGSQRPSFEVATIKLTDPNFGGILVGFPSGRFSARGFTGRDTTVQFLATGLQKLVLDRPILDKTGLTGKYYFDLAWRPDPSQFRGNGDKVPSDPNNPDLFAALQEQLGLKLTAQKAPADVIVIDAAEKPTEN
jgi:hypothetical protein